MLWNKLEVGDIVLLHENEQAPADVVVLATSDPDGMCYLETKNLDEETNLKPRKAMKATTTITTEEDIDQSRLACEPVSLPRRAELLHGSALHNTHRSLPRSCLLVLLYSTEEIPHPG